MKGIGAIILAGGLSQRMGLSILKPYLNLKGKTILSYSLDLFQDFEECVVVADPKFHSHFEGYMTAIPGFRRQDSVYNGLQKLSKPWVMIHDAARPLITKPYLKCLWEEGKDIGAAALARPIAYTIKKADFSNTVLNTVDRSHLWEIQTPQLVRRDLLLKGFEKAIKEKIDVTDDVSLVEILGHPVKLVKGSPFNLKITTPEDMQIAEAYLGCL